MGLTLTPSGASFGSLTGAPGDNTDLATALAAKLALAGGTMTGALAVTPGTLATTGFRLAQTWNSAGTTCRGLEVAITNTSSATASTPLRVCGGAAGTTDLLVLNSAGQLSIPNDQPIGRSSALGLNFKDYSTALNAVQVLVGSTNRFAVGTDAVTCLVPLRLNNAAVAATPAATHTVTVQDSTGTTYRLLCVV